MKKLIAFAFLPWLLSGFGYKAMAQQNSEKENKEKKETREIIIRKKGDKDASLKLEFKNDEILINGKSLIEFNDDEISINKRKIIINQGRLFDNYNEMAEQFKNGLGQNFSFKMGEPTTFLGVTSSANEAGAKVEAVTPNSPADAAGLQKGDIISKVESDKISGPDDLMKAITERKKGDKVKIQYIRNGKKKNAQATLSETNKNRVFSFSAPGEGSKTIVIPRVEGMPPAMRFDRDFNWNEQDITRNFMFNRKPKLGIKIQDTEDETGVKILEVEEGSLSADAGLKVDDILTTIDDAKISTTDDAREALVKAKDKTNYLVTVKRAGKPMNFTIKIPKVLKTVDL